MKRYKVAGLAAWIAVVMLAARSDAGAPVWQTAVGLMVCGVLALWAWLGYQRGTVDKRHREQTRRRRGA
ncbi:hypothetical protein NE562_11675 [Butyricicoccus faecihominis]|uniref:hypothetical protein n=1 Tax=Butyricicoccus faecihominis TaxID=1712515 RepID=UPI00247AAAC0|nr:hypothetical protein [Butyricicoccus faecihominis]MCQ5130322.1 hypothetical protein [Butyricicoccus faecihominis]